MLKPTSLREAITATTSWLAQNPDKLLVFIDHGSVVSAGGRSHSHEYRYTLNLVLTDYPLHPSAVMTPLLAWLSENQPEVPLNPLLNEQAVSFEADILSHSSMDLSIKIILTERVVVTRDPDTGALTAEHVPEPPLDPFADVESWEEIFVQPNTAPDWTTPDPTPA
jgi:tail completion protein R (GpR)